MEKKQKVFHDIVVPGKHKPSVTSKPILVTNHPLVQDPMVTPVVDDDTKTTEEPVKHEELHLDIPAVDSSKNNDDEPSPVEVSHDVPDADHGVSSPLPSPVSEAAEHDNLTEEISTQPTNTDEPASPAANNKSDDNEAITVNEAEIKRAEHEAEIAELVTSKKYFLHIDDYLAKQKTRKFVSLGILAAIVLAVAWVDVALDSGIITLGNIKAPTHFFSVSTSTDSDVNSNTQPSTVRYGSKIDKTSFSYPASWKMQTEQAGTQENVMLVPKNQSGNIAAAIYFGRNPVWNTPMMGPKPDTTIAQVTYRKLAVKSDDKPLYMRTVISKDSADVYGVDYSVTGDNSLKSGAVVYASGLTETGFTAPNGKDTLTFYASASLTSNSKDITAVQKFVSTNPISLQIVNTLESLHLPISQQK